MLETVLIGRQNQRGCQLRSMGVEGHGSEIFSGGYTSGPPSLGSLNGPPQTTMLDLRLSVVFGAVPLGQPPFLVSLQETYVLYQRRYPL